MPLHASTASVRFLVLVGDQLDEVRDLDKAMKVALRHAREAFEADEVCFASKLPGRSRVAPMVSMPAGALWDAALLTSFLGERRPKMPPRLLAAPLQRRGRVWGVLALRRARREFELEDVREVARVAQLVSRAIERLEAARLSDVRQRIDRKMLEQLRRNDLFYQILHGLRSLTGYDHSAAILLREEPEGPLRLVAEQIAWRKGKSLRIGIERRLDAAAAAHLDAGRAVGFDLEGGRWRAWDGASPESLAAALDYNGADGERREMSLLCAPLSTRSGASGLIKVAGLHPATLGPYEAELVARFLPHAAIALHNVHHASALESEILEAERKHALANLARGVSHDVHNALGSMLPLVQQLVHDARAGSLEPRTAVEDLLQVEESLRVCRRIFGGMLNLARGQGAGLGEGNLRRAVDSTLAVLEDSMRRQGVQVVLELPETLPSVRCAQGDLEQLLLNLATNARDAMPAGGELCIRVAEERDALVVEVRDTGCGIPPEHLQRVREPFFSTKRSGSGLGLSICRSILGTIGGRMAIESQPGEGTRVRLRLPLAGAQEACDEDAPEEDEG